MKKVYTAEHPAEAHVVKTVLESDGIAAVVRGEMLTRVRKALSVWVLDESQLERARELVADFEAHQRETATGGYSWRCGQCGEDVEPQFSACWNCGRPRADLT